jgi:hypothetical protein
VVVAIVALASQGDSRPSLDDWEAEWRSFAALIPDQDEVTGSDQESLCGAAVGSMRQAEADLVPAPNADLDAAALAWVEFAESVFFECPLRTGDHVGFEAGYEEIDRLAAEIEALIAFERSLGDG